MFFLLKTMIFHVGDPQAQDVRANEFKHQNNGQRRNHRDGDNVKSAAPEEK
jgi:hypothetical protein